MRRFVMLAKKPRELRKSQQLDRKREPKRTDAGAEDRDLSVGEGGTIETPPLTSDVSRDD
jgi:hypothetical protein